MALERPIRTDPLPITQGDAQPARPPGSLSSWKNWIGLVPFFAFAIFFLFLPSMSIVYRSFESPQHTFTLDNVIAIFTERSLINAYTASLKISLITAAGGAVFGFLLAYAVIMGGLPRAIRTFLTTFSGVASN